MEQQRGLLVGALNYVFPTKESQIFRPATSSKQADQNLRSYISPVQLQRLRHDVQMWRDCVREAEQAWFPHRVKMQRMFIDTILSGHTLACIKRRKKLTLLREWYIETNGEKDEKLTELLNKKWLSVFIEYALEAKFFGYSLIALGDMVDMEFPDVEIIRRFNVSPDRCNVTSYVYSISGANFLEEPYSDWHVWVTTPSDVGVSKVGYGDLYNVALYEIICRNVLGFNTDAAELYGMPARIGTTTKTNEDERAAFEQALAKMGSSGYILKDALDEVELLEPKGNGQGFKIYDNLESRCEKKISKILLGHADALDSTPGKLGSGDGEDSPAGLALKDTQTEDGAFIEDVFNSQLKAKLIKIGFPLGPNSKFKFDNNKEAIAARIAEDRNNKATADIAQVMKNAGLKMDAAYFQERTGIPTTDNIAPEPEEKKIPEAVVNRLKALYK